MEAINIKMLAGETGVAEYTFQGIDKIAGFAPVGINGWSISATQEFSKLSENLKQMVDQFKF